MRVFNITKMAVSPKKWWKKLPKFSKVWLARGFGVLAFLGVALFAYILFTMPSASDLQARVVDESTKIYDREGGLLYEVHGEVKRTRISGDSIPEVVRQATVAIEDKDFYKHRGVSVRGIFRSVVINILRFDKSQGGSTITQQLVKNALLDREKTWTRKLKEALLAVQVESRFTKEEILNLYLNEVPYGRNAYGVEAASQSYFGKSAKDLNLAESAYLAALPQAPSFYNPFGQNRKSLDARKDKVLEVMAEQGVIDGSTKEQAKTATVNFLPPKASFRAPHFVAFVQDYLTEKYGENSAKTAGLKVYTTLSPRLQDAAEKAVREGAEKNLAKGAHNAALIAIDPKSGEILAMVGSRDYFADSSPENCQAGNTCKFEPHYNAALGLRQPGSSFKPYAYMTAFGPDFKYAPASLLMDVETNFGTYNGKAYIPSNYNGQEYGPISARQALAGSLNIPAVKIVALVGVERVIETVRSMGITAPMRDCGLSLVLGGCEVTLLDHTAGYATIAAGGVAHQPFGILRIVDRDGKELENFQNEGKRVVGEKEAFLVTDILRDTDSRRFIFGANTTMVIPGRTVAGKTGTTQNWRDGWMMGFTPSLAAGVWVGNNDGSYMKPGADGSVVAAPIWKNFLIEALKGYPEEAFAEPNGIVRVEVDAVSGKLPGAYTTSTKTDVFADYSVPTDYDNTKVGVLIDSRTGAVVSGSTPLSEVPQEFRQTKIYTVFRSERPDNLLWEEAVQRWMTAKGYEPLPFGVDVVPVGKPLPADGDGQTSVKVLSPQDGEVLFGEMIDIRFEVVGNPQKVSVLLDGEEARSFTDDFNQSFLLSVSPGAHSLVFVVTLPSGKVTRKVVSFTMAKENELLMLPGDYNSVLGELTLLAKSKQVFSNVSFYSVSTKTGKSKLLGEAVTEKQPDDTYLYSITAYDLPAGKQTFFAKAGSVVSERVSVEIE